jgi:hypothetical protein
METICSSETWVDFQQTALRYIQEYSTFCNHRYKNFKSYKFEGRLIAISVIEHGSEEGQSS